MSTIVDRVISAVGTQKALAEAIGIKPPSINGWKRRKRIPPDRVLEVERITGISRHELRGEAPPSPVTPPSEGGGV